MPGNSQHWDHPLPLGSNTNLEATGEKEPLLRTSSPREFEKTVIPLLSESKSQLERMKSGTSRLGRKRNEGRPHVGLERKQQGCERTLST